jgi:hypothetical protein
MKDLSVSQKFGYIKRFTLTFSVFLIASALIFFLIVYYYFPVRLLEYLESPDNPFLATRYNIKNLSHDGALVQTSIRASVLCYIPLHQEATVFYFSTEEGKFGKYPTGEIYIDPAEKINYLYNYTFPFEVLDMPLFNKVGHGLLYALSTNNYTHLENVTLFIQADLRYRSFGGLLKWNIPYQLKIPLGGNSPSNSSSSDAIVNTSGNDSLSPPSHNSTNDSNDMSFLQVKNVTMGVNPSIEFFFNNTLPLMFDLGHVDFEIAFNNVTLVNFKIY